MKENKNNEKRLSEAYVHLLEQKDASEITIVELCDEAGVSRNYFYTHFNNIYDIEEIVQKRFEAPFLEYIDKFEEFNGKTIKEMSKNEFIDMLKNTFWPYYLEKIRENKVFVINVMRNYSFCMWDNSKRIIYKTVWEPFFEYYDIPKRMRKKLFVYYWSAIMAMIYCWIEDGCVEPTNELLDDLKFCFNVKIDDF